MTPRTCGEACWTAKGDDCSCVCGGANHGILRQRETGDLFEDEQEDPDVLEIPRRTRRIRRTWYTLAHVCGQHERAVFWQAEYIGDLNDGDDWLGRSCPRGSERPKAFIELATKAQQGWLELEGYSERPWLVWVREDVPLCEVESLTE